MEGFMAEGRQVRARADPSPPPACCSLPAPPPTTTHTHAHKNLPPPAPTHTLPTLRRRRRCKQVRTLREILARLRETYCGPIGYEYMHIPDRDRCNWLRARIEPAERADYTPELKLRILDRWGGGDGGGEEGGACGWRG